MWIKLSDAVLSTSNYNILPLRQYSNFRFFIDKTQTLDNSHFPPTWIDYYCSHFILYTNDGMLLVDSPIEAPL